MNNDELKAELDQCNVIISELDLSKVNYDEIKALLMQQRAIIVEMINSLEI